jgi:YihY family inner membrane protein
MNVIERGIRRVDAAQQRFTPSAFVVGVVKKYGDDNGGTLASSLAHSALVSVFPLLLILSTVLGLVAAGNPELKKKIQDAAAQQVPLIGQQLTSSVTELHKSSQIGLVVGLAVLVWGATGLAQSALYTMEEVWNLPGPARPGFFPRLVRSVLFLAILGLGVLSTTLLTSLDAFTQRSGAFVTLVDLLALVANFGLYLASFRVLTPKGVPTRSLVPGAVVGTVVWTLLQYFGVRIVHHFIQSSSVYGVFGTVLALVAWLYLAVQVTVYSAEINVVLARRLWPRSLIQPPLTEADRTVLALQALQNQRREEQQVTVTFTDRSAGQRPGGPDQPRAPQTPDEIVPPAPPGPDGNPSAGQR